MWVPRSSYAVHIETKYLRLSNPVSLGDYVEGWRVCWLGGWDKSRVLYVVMVERIKPEADRHLRQRAPSELSKGKTLPIQPSPASLHGNALTTAPALENGDALPHKAHRGEATPFPKPASAPIDTLEHTITISCGAETYAMTIRAKIERVTHPPMYIPSAQFQRGRGLEYCQLGPAPEGDDSDLSLTRGPSLCTSGAELSCLCSPGGVMNVITAVDTAQGDHSKMKHFTIDAENHITVHGSRKAARETHAGVFSTEEQFADLIGSDSQRLLEIWNSLPGIKAVSKFANRKVATERIWKAIQSLGENAATLPPTEEPDGSAAEATPPRAKSENLQNTTETALELAATVGPQAPDVAPRAGKASKKTTRSGKPATSEPPAKVARQGSKTEQAIAMMKRPGGATLKQLMDTMDWQAHTVRGFVAGTLTKKLGLTVASTKPAGGERTYSIAS